MFKKRKENRERIVKLMENILLYNEAGDYEMAYSYVQELDKLIKYIPYSYRKSYMAVCDEVSNRYMLLLLHKCKDNIDSCKQLCEDIIEICGRVVYMATEGEIDMHNDKDFIYITNIKQVKFYLDNGLKPVDLVSYKDMVAYKYDREATKPLYTKWKATKPN